MWLLKHSVSNALEALTHSKSLEHIIRQWPSRSTLKSCRGIGQKASGKANEFWELGKMVWELREGQFPTFNTGFSFDFFTKTFRKATKHQQTQPCNGGVPRKQATTTTSLASFHGRRRTAFAGTSAKSQGSLAVLTVFQIQRVQKKKWLNDMNCKIHFTATSNQLVVFFGLL